jgi:hypothetical protein
MREISMQKVLKALVFVGGIGCLFTLTGCPNPNIYGSPRTTPAGKISHSIAAEVIGAHTNSGGVTVPTTPTYTLRVGATDNLDIGIRIANMTTLGVDGKFNFLKSRSFDMAVDPGAQVFYYSMSASSGTGTDTTSASTSVAGTYLHLPLLFGINLSESFTLMPTAGIMYGIVSGSSSSNSSSGNDSVKASANTGIIGRFGLGMNIRVSQGFAMQPEFTIMKPFKDSDSGFLYLGGFGFNFGALPGYEDSK